MHSALTLLWTATAITVVVLVTTTLKPVKAGDTQEKNHVVEIRNLEITPNELAVAPGDTITWVNYDIVPHTVTADDKSWDSGLIKANGQWEIVVIKDMLPSYFCQYHPTMKANLSIKQE